MVGLCQWLRDCLRYLGQGLDKLLNDRSLVILLPRSSLLLHSFGFGKALLERDFRFRQATGLYCVCFCLTFLANGNGPLLRLLLLHPFGEWQPLPRQPVLLTRISARLQAFRRGTARPRQVCAPWLRVPFLYAGFPVPGHRFVSICSSSARINWLVILSWSVPARLASVRLRATSLS